VRVKSMSTGFLYLPATAFSIDVVRITVANIVILFVPRGGESKTKPGVVPY
jgi:hypothetical protein